MGKITKKYLGLILALSIMGSGVVFADDNVTTEKLDTDNVTTEEIDTDNPSEWAIRDLSMARTFAIGGPDDFSDFTTEMDQDNMISVIDSLREQCGLGIKDSYKDLKCTKLDLINELYDTTKEVYATQKRPDLVKSMTQKPLVYFLSRGVISGDNGGFALDKNCTKEELIVIVERAFENILRELGYSTPGLFWEVSDGNNKVYLFGSIHIGNDGLYPLSKSVMDAYKESENLVVEADIVYAENTSEYVKSIMYIEGDKTAKDLLDVRTYRLYSKIMEDNGVEKKVYDKLDPWYSSILLSSMSTSDVIYGGDNIPALGLDQYFLLGKEDRDVIELEGAKYQFDMMEGFSTGLQIDMLRNALAVASSTTSSSNDETTASSSHEKAINETFDSWKKSDSTRLGNIIDSSNRYNENHSFITKEYVEKMYYNRNNEMTEKIIAMIADDKEDYFVVTGAAHMVGEKGIVQQLLAKGYSVKQIKN